jgi:hypothetical protein
MSIDMRGVAARQQPADRQRVTAEQCDTLFAAIQVHDEIHLDAVLPETMHLDYTPDQFERSFLLARQLWDSGVQRRALIGLATKLASGRRLAPADMDEFKDIRARFKQLRFASMIFDESHRYSPALHQFTKTMGHLQDALKNGRMFGVTVRAVMLRLLLTPLAYRRMKRGLDRFRPSSQAHFRAYVNGELDVIRAFLAKPGVTGKEFHEVRKIASRLMAIYDSMNTLYPSAYHRQITLFISTINGMMGGMHDGLIERRLSGEQDYHAETFPLAPEIGQRLWRLERSLADAAAPGGSGV